MTPSYGNSGFLPYGRPSLVPTIFVELGFSNLFMYHLVLSHYLNVKN
ncbi:hypothetical protein DDB_G0275369 [Dictyostelium discoideum AX4]|uniref:Uncharacterized protein n=1 Tax=Dictyostelium discoideum TaxID=44689 RepID=Q553T8_DICDI|nr:hypothetical protein DDB_G0275369 [Dictyostelium discoideum AX4]EAL69750.1 hypothetical protein DDB_G0275369 [Dictyostelium discoideum AX4]|eukprot:XP_643689.1 hypothetical protein DDB_G0275369 [Dictyostelium discoideum AX4]